MNKEQEKLKQLTIMQRQSCTHSALVGGQS